MICESRGNISRILNYKDTLIHILLFSNQPFFGFSDVCTLYYNVTSFVQILAPHGALYR